MGLVENLAASCKDFPQARVVAFADLSSSTVLASQGRANVTQEHLNMLCSQARASFDDPLFSLSVEAFGEPNAAVIMDQVSVRVFLRSENDPADAICCICDHGIDLAAFVARVRDILEQLDAGT